MWNIAAACPVSKEIKLMNQIKVQVKCSEDRIRAYLWRVERLESPAPALLMNWTGLGDCSTGLPFPLVLLVISPSGSEVAESLSKISSEEIIKFNLQICIYLLGSSIEMKSGKKVSSALLSCSRNSNAQTLKTQWNPGAPKTLLGGVQVKTFS